MSDEGQAFLLGILVGAMIGAIAIGSVMESRAVKAGHAYYHPTTGKWQWKPTPTPGLLCAEESAERGERSR